MCHNLFALYDPQSHCWYSPNHSIDPQNVTTLELHFRIRYSSRVTLQYVRVFVCAHITVVFLIFL